MTKTAKLNLTFLIIAIFSIGGSYAYVLLTNGMELPIYADLLVAQLLILLPAWGYTKKEHINLYKEIRHRRLRFGALLCLVGITLLSMPLLSFLNLFSSLFVPNAAAGLAEQMTKCTLKRILAHLQFSFNLIRLCLLAKWQISAKRLHCI